MEEYLERTGVTRVFASYWVAYRLSFETDERIIATPLPDDTMRYEPFWNAVRASNAAAYILLDSHFTMGPTVNWPLRPITGARRVGRFLVFSPLGKGR